MGGTRQAEMAVILSQAYQLRYARSRRGQHVHFQSRGTGFGGTVSVICIRTLTHEFRVLTDCPQAARTLAYVETRPQILIPPPAVAELQVERAHGFYRLSLPKGGMVEGSALHLLDALHRFILALLEEEAPGAPLIHAGSICLEGVPMLLIGGKSSGKTTLALELLANGHVVEGDEHVIVRESDLIARPRTLRVKASSLTLVPGLADRIRQTPSVLDWESCPIYAVSPAIVGNKWEISPMHPRHIIFLEANHGGHTVAKPITTEEAFRGSFHVAFSPRWHRPEPLLAYDVWRGKHKRGKCRSATLLGHSATCSPSRARLKFPIWGGSHERRKIDLLLKKVDIERRIALKRLILGTVFAVPAIVSFPMDGLKMYSLAMAGNSSSSGPINILK